MFLEISNWGSKRKNRFSCLEKKIFTLELIIKKKIFHYLK